MIYTPQKRLYAPDDPFFQEGNIALRAIWLARDAESEHEIDMIREQADSIQKDLSRPIYCALPSCCSRQGVPAEFPSVTAYELHYETRHRNVCAACGKVFPGHHWLQLHLDECHNVLIQMRKDRGEKVFRCFVESCEKQFVSPKMRRLHLIDKHKYPKNFPFDLVMTGTLSFEERRARSMRNKPEKHAQQQAGPPLAMDMDDLTSQMSRLKIPKSISFGRMKPSFPRRHAVPSSTESTRETEMKG